MGYNIIIIILIYGNSARVPASYKLQQDNYIYECTQNEMIPIVFSCTAGHIEVLQITN